MTLLSCLALTLDMAITYAIAIAGVMLFYAYAAGGKLKQSTIYQNLTRRTAAALLLGSGAFLLTRN